MIVTYLQWQADQTGVGNRRLFDRPSPVPRDLASQPLQSPSTCSRYLWDRRNTDQKLGCMDAPDEKHIPDVFDIGSGRIERLFHVIPCQLRESTRLKLYLFESVVYLSKTLIYGSIL